MEIKTQRTILRHGISSLCVTIPYTWALDHKVRQGDKVQLTTKDNTLIITLINGEKQK
jgi:hypothetical protein